MKNPYHFLGVGGIGMSALAHILLEKGEEVSGTDLKDISHLEKLGIKVLDTLPSKGTIIYSSAIKKDHPHFLEAQKKGFLLLHRSDLLGILLEGKKGLLVAGTHGKTTTSSLLSWTLHVAGKYPTFAIGGILKNFQKNGGYGKGEHFVIEADESDGTFLNYSGVGAIVTNIEKEHLDYWKGEDQLIKGFKRMLKKVKNPELLFWCSDDPLLKKLSPQGISYGKTGELKLLSCIQEGKETIFTAAFKGKTYSDIRLSLMGEVLALNALAVFGMALQLGIDEKEVRKAFSTFEGVKRRQEKIGESGRVTIYDDYAHHPTEIRALLKAFRGGMKTGRLIALFQPHRVTRTRDLLADFKNAFHEADLTIITDIYSAGEKPIRGINGKRLVKEMKGEPALFLEKEKILSYLPKMLIPGDVLILMGAGDITTYGPQLLKNLL